MLLPAAGRDARFAACGAGDGRLVRRARGWAIPFGLTSLERGGRARDARLEAMGRRTLRERGLLDREPDAA
jgi:hypothetical protein